MIVVGLTGSIAMGKSTVASMFERMGSPVFDADAVVRSYYDGEGAEDVERLFPGVLVEGRVDRDRLSHLALGDRSALQRLESLVHPHVAQKRRNFVDNAKANGQRLIVLDVPLLIEAGGESAVDIVLLVSAPEPVQRARAMARKGMTEVKLESILSRQSSDAEKRRRSHFIVDTSGGLEDTRAQATQFLRSVSAMQS
jgi:dephospho-CoA kinase